MAKTEAAIEAKTPSTEARKEAPAGSQPAEQCSIAKCGRSIKAARSPEV
jgi:hypothetical protein